MLRPLPGGGRLLVGDARLVPAWKLGTIRAEPDMTAFATAPMQIASAVKVERGDGYMVGVLAPRARFKGDALEVPWNGRIRHQATAVYLGSGAGANEL